VDFLVDLDVNLDMNLVPIFDSPSKSTMFKSRLRSSRRVKDHVHQDDNADVNEAGSSTACWVHE